MNIFFHELRAYRKSTLLWTFALLLTILVFLSMYPAFTKDLEITKKLLTGFPEPVRKAIGISMDSFFTLLGFYSFVFTYIMLCGSIQAMNYGLSVLSKEVTAHTADFLLTKPIKRTTIITAKLMAILSSLLFTNIIYNIFAGGMLFILKTETFSWKVFLLISLSLFFVQLIFLTMGLLISVIKPRIKSVITISLATVFGFFILDMFNSVVKDQKLRYILPYKYFDSIYIIQHGSYELTYLVITIVFVICATLTSYRIYVKKDFLL
jgi:ABC-2 type transport system permease protein